MSDVDALIVALADGKTVRDAALAARMPSARAVAEARACGWPDMDAIRAAAKEIRERHAQTAEATPEASPAPISREETPMPRPVPRPRRGRADEIPIEGDVEAAITRGARHAEAARDAASEGQPQPEAEATATPAMPVQRPEITADLDPIVDRTDELEAARLGRRDRADALDVEDILRRIDQLAESTAIDSIQAERDARAEAVRTAADLLRSTGVMTAGPLTGHVREVIALADYIMTGYVTTGDGAR